MRAMRARYFILFFIGIALAFGFGVPVQAAVIDSQTNDSAQATRPPTSYYWFWPVSIPVSNYLAIGYIPKNNLSFAGVRFRVNTSGSGDYVCPVNSAVMEYYSTTTPPSLWDNGVVVGSLSTVATTTPDANGNCDYMTRDKYDTDVPLIFSANRYYVFFMSTGPYPGWVSMSGKPYSSDTQVSFFGYRPATDNRYVWGTSGLDAPYFEFFDTAPPASPPVVPPDPCVATNTCASNVLFLPGIEASRLYEDIPCANGVCETRLWEPGGDTLSSRLAHTTDGVSINTDIFTKKNDVIDNAYFPIKGNVYESFIKQMSNLVTAGTINEWEAVPYDWRLTPSQILESGAEITPGKISYLVATSSPYIIQELKRLAATSKTKKVTIVAHSNGGLITKALTDKLGPDASKYIDKIVFVAVPQIGTAQAIGALLHGYDQGLPLDFLSYKLSDSVARFLATNMPMTYNLLPSSVYFKQVNTPVVTFTNQPILADFRARYGDNINSSELLHAFITDSWRTASSTTEGLNYPSVGNNLLLTNAETLHNTDLDLWTPPTGITLYEIAGWGENTLAGIDYYQGTATHCDQFSGVLSRCTSTPKIDYRPRIVLDGDGTVVTPSALWTPGANRYWVDLKSYNKGFTIDRKHPSILEVPQLRTFLQNIITNNDSANLPQYISTSVPTNPNPDTELRFTLHSPLTLNLYDDQGHHTGISTTTGELEENIPDSSYLKFGEVQFISVPTSIHTTLIMNGYSDGSFTLDAEEVNGENIVASTTFAGIPSFTTTTATMDMPSGGLANVGALVVDENSDGRDEIVLAPKLGDTVTFETIPPEFQLAFSTSTQSVVVTSTDDMGTTTMTLSTAYPVLKKSQKSGIATTTLIARDASGNVTNLVYTEPFPTATQSDTITLRTIAYNGATTTLASTAVSYAWNIYKKDLYRTFDSSLSTGLGTVTSSYSSKDNKTTVLPSNQTLSGMVIPYMTTEKGSVKIIY